MSARSRRKKGRRRYHHGDLRGALIEASVRIVEDNGVQALSLRGAARAAGVSHMAPYNHFADRAALVAAVGAVGYDRLTAELSSAMGLHAGRPARQLQEAGVAYVRFAVGNPELFRLMFSPELSDTSAHPDLAEAAARTLGLLAGALDSSAAAPGPGKTRASGKAESSDQTRLLPVMAWSLVHGVAVLLLDGQFGSPATLEEAERYGRAATDLLWSGLRAAIGG